MNLNNEPPFYPQKGTLELKFDMGLGNHTNYIDIPKIDQMVADIFNEVKKTMEKTISPVHFEDIESVGEDNSLIYKVTYWHNEIMPHVALS